MIGKAPHAGPFHWINKDMIKRFNSFLNESLDIDFIEEEVAGMDEIPDCMPNNAREWLAFRDQYERLRALRKELYRGKIDRDRVIAAAKAVSADAKPARLDLMLTTNKYGSLATIKENIGREWLDNEFELIVKIMVLDGQPYKKSIFEVLHDLKNSAWHDLIETMEHGGLYLNALKNDMKYAARRLTDMFFDGKLSIARNESKVKMAFGDFAAKEIRIDESLDLDFIEEEVSKIGDLPDCMPNNAREWHAFGQQLHRLHELKKKLYYCRMDRNEILDAAKRSDAASGTKYFEQLSDKKNWLGDKRSFLGWKSHMFKNIIREIVLDGQPYKKSIFEVLYDLKTPYEADRPLGINKIMDLFELGGLNLVAVQDSIQYSADRMIELFNKIIDETAFGFAGHVLKFGEFVNESYFDVDFAEEHFAALGEMPDSIPNNAREWSNFAKQLDRLSDVAKRLHAKRLRISEVIKAVEALGGVERFNFMQEFIARRDTIDADPSAFRASGLYMQLKTEVGLIAKELVLEGMPHKKSIFEVENDFRERFEQRSWPSFHHGPLDDALDVFSAAGFDPRTVNERMRKIERDLMELIIEEWPR